MIVRQRAVMAGNDETSLMQSSRQKRVNTQYIVLTQFSLDAI